VQITPIHLVSVTRQEAPATEDQIAALEFPAIKQFRAMSKAKRAERALELTNEVYKAVQIALETMSRDKAEIVAMVRSNHDLWGGALLEFAESGRAAAALLEIIQSAEARLAVAVAVVEGC
jgi:hypothetical protein